MSASSSAISKSSVDDDASSSEEVESTESSKAGPEVEPSQKPSPHRRLGILVLILLAISPAIFTGYAVATHAVNIPVWDGWERAVLLKKYYEGDLDFAYLYSPHIDHRMFFPRLVFLGLNELSGGDVRWECYFIFGSLVAASVFLGMFCHRIFRSATWTWTMVFILNLFLFNPLQYQNLLWPVQVAMVLPIACLCGIVWAMTSRMNVWAKFAVVLVAATIGTHSFGHGLALWPVVVGLAILLPDFGPRRREFIILSVTVGLATIAAYFTVDFNVHESSMHSYGAEPGSATPGMHSLLEREKDFDDVTRFAFVGIGSVIARVLHTDPTVVVTDAGRGLMIAFAVLSIFLLVRWKDKELRAALLPWLAMGGYSVVAATALALGRNGLDRYRALLTRYMTPTMFVAIAIVGIVAYLLYRWQSNEKSSYSRETRTRWALGLAVFISMVMIPQWVYGMHKMEAWKLSRLQGRVALLYLNHHETKWPGRVEKDPEFLREQADYLNSKGLLDPPMFEKFDFGSFEKVERDGKKPYALSKRRVEVSKAFVNGLDLWTEGYALLGEGHGRIADGVLLTWRKEGESDWKVIALWEMAAINVARVSVVDSHFQHSKSLSRPNAFAKWEASASLADLPDGRLEFRAWALNAEKMKAYLFHDRFWIEKGGESTQLHYDGTVVRTEDVGKDV
ncbi:MAG: hypothetical protein AAGA58_13435 [Verrucomicrobiota bacterium]